MRAHWEIIGQALREARDEIEGSQREVAEWLDMQPLSKYCDCEDGKADPHEVLRQLMSALVGRNKWAALCGQLKQERDEARDRYNELLGVKKVPKWYNGREIPITAQEAAK